MNNFRPMRAITRIIQPSQIRELSLLLIIGLIIYFFGTEIPRYYSWRTYNRISAAVAIITVVGVGQTLVVLTRNIDLSVGSIVGFTAFFVGRQVSNDETLSLEMVILMSLGLGAGLGLVNGIIVAYGKVPSIVATLGTLALYRGIFFEYSDATTITTRELPDWIKDLPREVLYTVESLDGLEIRTLVAIAVVTVVLFQLMLSFTTFGRRLYAIGSNPEAAEMAGMPSRRIVTLAFTLCGALSGLAGFMWLARFGVITITAAQGLELQVVAAVVVGGVNIFGGSGTMIGAMLGAVLISTLENSLIRLRTVDNWLLQVDDVSEFWKDALLGLFILLAIAVDAVILNRLRDLWARTQLRRRKPDTEAAEDTVDDDPADPTDMTDMNPLQESSD